MPEKFEDGIVTNNSVDGIDVTLHGSRHTSAGADPIPVATTTVAGIMSASDKALLDSLVSQSGIIALIAQIRNETGSTIAKHKLVAVTGFSVAENRPLVSLADKDTPSLRPAIGITQSAIPNNSNADVLIVGRLGGFDTSSFGLTDQLVLGNSGGILRPPPDQDPFTGEIQLIGHVSRVDVVDGEIIFTAATGLEPVTGAQVFALLGTSGTPGPTNKYVTDVDPRNANDRFPLPHASTHESGGSDELALGSLAGTLTDVQHGSRSGGSLHPLVTADPGGVAGFMSPADKSKLDGIATGATNTPLTSTPPSQIDIGDAGDAGISTEAARADHQHPLPTPAAPTNVDKSAASAGSSTIPARADHKHDIATGVPGTILPDDSASEGTAVSVARSDHKHAIATDSVLDISDNTNAEGASTAFSRADHIHGHGNRSGGSLHAVATPSVSGFMSAADKTKIDGMSANAADRDRFQFGGNTSVPSAGTLQLSGPGTTTVGVRLNRAGTITGASIQVDSADGTRSYNLDIRVNGISAATMALATGNSGAHSTSLTAVVVAGDIITAFIVRTAGAGASTFGAAHVLVEVTY